jgi:putative transposase
MSELVSFSEEARQAALERFHMIQPHLEQGKRLRDISRDASIPYRTVQRWVAQYRRLGLSGLVRKTRNDQGARRGLSTSIQHLIEGLALQKPPLSIAALYRQVERFAQEQNESPPSYSRVYDIVRRLPPDLVTLAHQGSKTYGEAFELIHRREAERPNAIWQGDHTLLDLLVKREGADPARPWLSIIIDDYSRAVMGYYLSWDAPSAIQIALALRQAIWRKDDARWSMCGIPDVLYTDNGSDFTSQHLEQAAADLKMQLIFSTPGKPRGRGRIERFFDTVSQLFLSELPGYPGSGRIRQEKALLSLTELDQQLRTFLLLTYHEREHSETRQRPKARWEQGGFLPRMPDSLEQLDLLLLSVPRARKVHPDGIRFQGYRYLDTTLAAFVGESVMLRYDPRDIAEIRVFHHGQFLCRAICPELAGTTIPLRDVIRARNRRRRELRGVLRDRAKTVEELLSLKSGGTSALELETEPNPLLPPKPTPLKRYLNE